jgi:tetratricopeptide (TPR) repeat protein
VISLRVEDDPDPLGELARLMTLHAAYALAGEADEHLAAGRSAQAAALYARVCEIAPGCDELRFWAGLAAAQTGDLDHAVALVAAAIDVHPGWRELLARLPPDIAPTALVARLR